MSTLIVISPFGGHARGDAITDATEVASVIAGPHRSSVVRIGAAAASTPEPTMAEAVAAGVAAAEAALHPRA